jgi:nucleoside 2-deoxyribosyltransferase
MAICFASGSSRPAHIRGFAAIGRAIGVAFPEVSPEAEAELLQLAGRGIPVFVDSGAFSEVEFGPDGPKVVRPIDAEGWAQRMALSRRLALALGDQAYLVAPDRIGDQEHTLALLQEWADELRDLAELGANVLVPIQKGRAPQAAFHQHVADALGFEGWVPAIPSKKNATTLDELRAYVEAARPRRLHLLGMGERNRQVAEALELVEAASPGCVVTLDANLIAASVGRSNGPSGMPRVLTRAQEQARVLVDEGVVRTSAQALGIILAFGEPAHLVAAIRRSRTVYLAGPIFGCTDAEAADWRAQVTRRLGSEVIYNPMTRDFRGREDDPAVVAEIVEGDKRDIDGCDAVLVYYPRPSVGTSMEVLYAHERGKHVVVANVSGGPVSPWIAYHATVCDGLEAAIVELERWRLAA